MTHFRGENMDFLQKLELLRLKDRGEAPEWLTIEGLKTLQGGYLIEKETPKDAYRRVAKAAAEALVSSGYKAHTKTFLEDKFFDLMWKNWLCPSTPVLANMGTERGLPISCFGSYVEDTMVGIMDTLKEVAMMSKYGGGTSGYFGDIRPAGSPVNGTGGVSNGNVAWLKIFDSMIASVSQGGVRRGAFAGYLPIEHKDTQDFLRIRRPEGDPNRQCLNLHHGVSIGDDFMQKVIDGSKLERKIWLDVLKTRSETGEPYIFFRDTAQKLDPVWYKAKGWSTKNSNLCTEIMLHVDKDRSFVCCLSSANLVRWDEFKNTDAIFFMTIFLDAVMTEFITKAKKLAGMERAVRFAEESRALGLGVLGWHTLLQEKMIAFDSFQAMQLNAEIFRTIHAEAIKASEMLAKELGEPELMKGFGRRNSHLIAVAPTVSNSIISGNVSAGIEPIAANAYVKKTAKGVFIQYNPTLEKLLESKGKNNEDTWKAIIKNEGSVQGLSFLTPEEKEVFLTAKEINQYAIIKQASQRQKWIDQGQSVNLFFASNSNPKYINGVHLSAWKEGLKSLYYFRSSSPLRADMASREESECKACEG
jgi:ribonucleoside-diphosphate reductase alpha chain